MLPVTFKDLNTYNAAYSGYQMTNEEPELISKLLKGQKFEKGGGICGGGDLLLQVFLPRCKEMVVVDHSYNSLSATWIKMLLLSTLGPRGFLDLIAQNNYTAGQAAIDKLLKDLSTSVAIPNMLPQVLEYYYWNWNEVEMKREWKHATEASLTKSLKRLNKLTIIHGDLSDLPKGELDFIYLSNAFEHINRDGIKPTDAVLDALKPGGTILNTVCQTSYQLPTPCKSASRIKGLRTSWEYQCVKTDSLLPVATDTPQAISMST